MRTPDARASTVVSSLQLSATTKMRYRSAAQSSRSRPCAVRVMTADSLCVGTIASKLQLPTGSRRYRQARGQKRSQQKVSARQRRGQAEDQQRRRGPTHAMIVSVKIPVVSAEWRSGISCLLTTASRNKAVMWVQSSSRQLYAGASRRTSAAIARISRQVATCSMTEFEGRGRSHCPESHNVGLRPLEIRSKRPRRSASASTPR
jgi:short subunit dehydrogenase-like uncharacterized protein